MIFGNDLLSSLVCSKFFSLIGLLFNTLASAILMIPFLSVKRKLDDDLIISGDSTKQEYTQKKHLKERETNLLGLAFLMLGFVFQIASMFL